MSQRAKIESLALDDVSFAYPNAAPLFENVSAVMPQSRMVWVRSPGGRGKSTLLRMLLGLAQPTSGRVLINGADIADFSFEKFLPYRLAMGYGFDMGGLLNNKSLFENLTLPLHYHKLWSESEVNARVSSALDAFGMTTSRGARPFAVSGSLRKLTCVLRAFLHEPQIVFLDDPLIGLKQDNVDDLILFMEKAFEEKGLGQVFFTSESPLLAEKFGAEELLISTDWFTTRVA